ncbi:hypothetical protein MTO98_16680 [Mucilaginibacter sp. SMC90]|uniref:hypothetical protein n=1 Tax=Mucilaginibacter sp. SMC90 TaxID=2929803 RepID=UPI001FB3955B|nr:hypothetical protein [Mucilaginibacter sp. SMC90]UOE52706.1 hypothetical protein MTO98_16680 [Mucilaginibacter sp. SMC90]
MSLDLQVYTNSLSDDLIPKIVKRLNDFDMVVEIHSAFSFNTQSGFLPFKFILTNPRFDVLKGKQLVSGFELFIDDFNLKSKKAELNPPPSKGLFQKLFGKKTSETLFAPLEFEEQLKNCTKEVTFVWHAGDSFELRFSALVSAVLTELTKGVCCYPADEIWYNTDTIVEDAYRDVQEFEGALTEKSLQYHEFQQWN